MHLARTACDADDRAVDPTVRRMREITVKPTLAALSRAVEQVAEAAGRDTTLIALFQRGAYFAPMVQRFEQIAAAGGIVIVGYEGEGPAAKGVHHVALAEDDELVAEWSVVFVSPTVGAYLVADDLLELDLRASDLESGRRFSATWGFGRFGAVAHGRRLLRDIEDRLPRDVREASWRMTDLATEHEVSPTEQALVLTAQVLADRFERTARALRTARDEVRAEAERASRDELTGLVNRTGLDRWLGGRATDGLPMPNLGVVMIDLDGFKQVNDIRGHLVGDELLQAVAGALVAATRPEDVVIRWGGDEFLVLCPGVAGPALAELAGRLVAAAGSPAVRGASVSASAGVQECSRRPFDLETADAAMYEAKRAGGAQVAIGRVAQGGADGAA